MHGRPDALAHAKVASAGIWPCSFKIAEALMLFG
jgi:hypothetical protein